MLRQPLKHLHILIVINLKYIIVSICPFVDSIAPKFAGSLVKYPK